MLRAEISIQGLSLLRLGRIAVLVVVLKVVVVVVAVGMVLVCYGIVLQDLELSVPDFAASGGGDLVVLVAVIRVLMRMYVIVERWREYSWRR